MQTGEEEENLECRLLRHNQGPLAQIETLNPRCDVHLFHFIISWKKELTNESNLSLWKIREYLHEYSFCKHSRKSSKEMDILILSIFALGALNMIKVECQSNSNYVCKAR